nr:conotoxin precursor N [Conus judaeus]
MLLLPLAAFDGDGQAIEGGGDLSAVSSPFMRLLERYKKNGRSIERSCDSENRCPNNVCCDGPNCKCLGLPTRISSIVWHVCVCPRPKKKYE